MTLGCALICLSALFLLFHAERMEEGYLSSLSKLEALRKANQSTVSRPQGSNVDIVVDPSTGETLALCHLSQIGPFSNGWGRSYRFSHEDTAAMTLALSHLNTGDGSIVPEVEGLDKRCPVRFTMEASDAGWSEGQALEFLVDQTRREPTGDSPVPCAFVGAYFSQATTPMAIITSILKYPMVSSIDTQVALNDQDLYPLLSRTVPSDNDNTIPLVLFFRDVLKLKHIAVINDNNEGSNAFVNGIRLAASNLAPEMVIQQIPYDADNGSAEFVVATLKASRFRFVYANVFGKQRLNELMEEAFRQGVAGNGLHNWIFGSGFLLSNDEDVFEQGSPLAKAYQ